jgi:hypothetical protein
VPPFVKICKNIISQKNKKDKKTLLLIDKKYQKGNI